MKTKREREREMNFSESDIKRPIPAFEPPIVVWYGR